MYAVIRTGGKQARVQEGDVIDVERLRGGNEISFQPLLVVGDDGTVVSDKDALSKASVTGRVTGERRGKKVEVFHFRNKTGYRKTQGHRQTYSQVEITKIAAPGIKSTAKKAPAKAGAPAKTETAKPAAKKPAAAKAATATKTTAAKKATTAKKTTAAKKATTKRTTATKRATTAKKTTAAKKATPKKSPAKKDE